MTALKPCYLAVAASCAVLHNATVIAGNWFGLHYLPSSALSFALVALWGYALHAHFTFRTALSARALLRYALAMAANYPLSIALMFLLCDLMGTAVALAAPLATGLLVCWNFLVSRQAFALGLEPRGWWAR
ncbi:MAG: GtrA family protein [Hyphomicrobiaceae bacterium]